MLAYTVQGRDVNLDIKRLVGYRQFCNKIWNAFRFATMYLKDFIPLLGMNRQLLHSVHIATRDKFILSRLNSITNECNNALTNYQFAACTSALHSFFLYDFCDLYLELIKPVITDTSSQKAQERSRLAQATLYIILEQYLRLLHPFMPFLSEELWQRLPHRDQMTDEPTIMLAPYPKDIEEWTDAEAEKDMALARDAIHAARSLRSDYKVPNHVKAYFFFRTDSEAIKAKMVEQAGDICTLIKGHNFTFLEMAANDNLPSGYCIKVLSDQLSILVDLTGLIDIDTEINRLNKDVERLASVIDGVRRKMAVKNYSKVPEEVQAANTEKLAASEAELEEMQRALKTFQAMKI